MNARSSVKRLTELTLQNMNTEIRLQRFLELDNRTCTHGPDYTVVR